LIHRSLKTRRQQEETTMPDSLSDSILELARNKIAAEVVNALNDDMKTSIISKAVSEIINSYSFKNRVIEEVVTKVAEREMTEYLNRPDVSEKIRTEVQLAIDRFIPAMGNAVTRAMVASFTASKQYGRDIPYLAEALRFELKMPDKD
jgi:hypothetical protein